MASLLTPPNPPTPLPPQEDGQLALWEGSGFLALDLTPHLLIQLEDDLERSRMREAFWISVVVHLMVVILLVFSPKIVSGMLKGVELNTPADLMRNQQMTYLDLPPDMQKEPKVAPKTNVLSDKNRIAESRHPTIDKKTLEELTPRRTAEDAFASGAAAAEVAAAAAGASSTASAATAKPGAGPAAGTVPARHPAGQSQAACAAAGDTEIPRQSGRNHVAGIID